jgi:TonB family protein
MPISETEKSAPCNKKQNSIIYYVYKSGEYVEEELDKIPMPKDCKKFNRKLISGLKYSSEAREAGLEGIVSIQVILDEFGNLVSAKIKEGIDEVSDKAALKAIKEAINLGFEPAYFNDKPVRVRYDFSLFYSLK